MKSKTLQETKWAGEFGESYTKRFNQGIDQIEQEFLDYHGVKRSDLDLEFLGSFDRSSRILEVGANIGMKLYSLQKLGFSNLFGIDIQEFAVRQSRNLHSSLNITVGSGFQIPFIDESFDVVYTSGVLIHISPAEIGKFMAEIYRCSKRYIWGWEYYSDQYEDVLYRGESDLLWKGNFPQIYRSYYPELTLVKEKKVPLNSSAHETNQMFLLKKP